MYLYTLSLYFYTLLLLSLCSNFDPCFYFTFRDAEDAVHSRDGYDYDGYRLRVEFPRGRERGPGGAFISGPRGSGSSRVRGPPARRSQYRVVVSGIFLFFQYIIVICCDNILFILKVYLQLVVGKILKII